VASFSRYPLRSSRPRRRCRHRSLFADKTVVQLGAVHVVVFDFNARVGFFEALDQRPGGFGVGGGIDDNLALFRAASTTF
jgi:hypothetical protein